MSDKEKASKPPVSRTRPKRPSESTRSHQTIPDQKEAALIHTDIGEIYRSLFDTMLNGFAYCRMIFDDDKPVDFIYLDVNKAFGKQTGLQNVVGKKVTEVIPGIRESDPELFEMFSRVALTGTPETFETYLKSLDMWFLVSVYSPQKEYFVAIFDVITERKKIEEQLKNSEVKYRRLFETAQDAILILDGDTGKIIDANPFLTELLGYSIEELLGKNLWEIGTFKDIVARKASFDELQKKGYIRYENLPLETKDGRQIAVEFVSNRYKVDQHNVFQCNIRDITERKHMEEELKTVNHLYALLSEINQAIVRIKDREQLFQSICRIAIDIGQFRMAWIGLIDNISGEVQLAAHCGFENGFIRTIPRLNRNDPPDDRPASIAIHTGKVAVSNDIGIDTEAQPRFSEAIKRGYRSMAVIPLKIKDMVVGNYVIFADKPGFFTAEEQKLLEEIGADISFALEALEIEQEHRRAEEALRQSEEKYRKLVETAEDVILVTDLNGKQIFRNSAYYTSVGYKIVDDKLLEDYSKIHPDDLTVINRSQAELREAGESTCEFRTQHRDGHWVYRQAKTVAIYDSNHKPEAYLSIIRDISEQKRMEGQLQVANRLYALLSEINQAIVRIKDRDQLFQAVCRIAVDIGKFRMAWIGIKDENSGIPRPVTHYGFEDGYLQTVPRVMKDEPAQGRPVTRAIQNGKIIVSNDIESEFKNIPWLAEALKRGYRSLAAIPLKIKDTIIGNLNVYADSPGFFTDEIQKLLEEIGTDISYALESLEIEQERQNAEKALRQSEEKYRKLVETANDTILLTDLDGNFLLRNSAYYASLGYEVGDEALIPYKNVHPDDLPVIKKSFEDVLKKGEAEVEYRARHRDGHWLYRQSKTVVINDSNNRPEAFLTIIRDVTEYKQMEAQLQAANRLYALLSDINEAVVRIKERDELFRTICKIAIDTGKFRMAWIGMVDAKNGTIKPVANYGYEQGYLKIVPAFMQNKPPQGRSISIAIREGQVVIINDIKKDFKTLSWRDEALKRGYRSLTTIPLKVNDKIIGNFSVYSDVIGFFTEDLKKLLIEIGADISYALESIETEKERQKAADEVLLNEVRLRGLLDILQHPAETVQELLDYALDKSIKLTKSKIGYIYFYDENRKEFTLNTWSKDVMQECTIQEPQTVYQLDKTGIWGEVVRQAKPVMVNDFQAYHPLKKGYPEEHSKLYKYLSIPIYKDSSIVAVIGVANKEKDYADTDVLQLTLLMNSVWKMVENKREEQALSESEERFRLMMENANDAVILHEVTPEIPGRFLEVNQRACNMLGYSREELLQMNIADIDVPELQLRRPEIRKRLFTDGQVIFETEYRAKDGHRIPVEISTSIFNLKGKPIVLSLIRDISDRKHLEDEQQRAAKLESVGILAGGIAHDFNNILTAILGNISLASMKVKPDDAVSDLLKEAEKASLRAKDLTQQLLTFAKGGVPLKKIVSITQLLRETANFALRGSSIRCQFVIPDDLWLVDIDEGQISQVINNLVINARQAMPAGGIIEIKAENITLTEQQSLGRILPIPKGDYIRIAVADHGIGIPPQYLDKIFDPYFTTKQTGSGLGLATSYSIMHNHQGYISVESVVNGGSTFYLYLPASDKKILDKKEADSNIVPVVNGKVLVMDDEAGVRDVIKRMLMNIGYTEIECVADGNEAINIYKRAKESGKPFDVVILDLTIPGGMGGKETIQKLLEIDPQVNAIVSSGYTSEVVMSEYKQYGFKGVMSKPYTLEQLSRVLHEVTTNNK